jgi:hypothetical protein
MAYMRDGTPKWGRVPGTHPATPEQSRRITGMGANHPASRAICRRDMDVE